MFLFDMILFLLLATWIFISCKSSTPTPPRRSMMSEKSTKRKRSCTALSPVKSHKLEPPKLQLNHQTAANTNKTAAATSPVITDDKTQKNESGEKEKEKVKETEKPRPIEASPAKSPCKKEAETLEEKHAKELETFQF